MKLDVASARFDGAELELLRRTLHQGRNLAMCVRGYAELIQEREAAPERHGQWAGRIVDQLDRLTEMYARAEGLRPTLEPVRERIALRELAGRAEQLARATVGGQADRPAVRWRVAPDHRTQGDRKELEKALVPLLVNALEAGGPGTLVDVELVAGHRGGWALSIADRGEGFGGEALSRAGEPFFSRKEGHLGLGLYFSQAILTRQQLALELSERPGGGAVATVRATPKHPGGER